MNNGSSIHPSHHHGHFTREIKELLHAFPHKLASFAKENVVLCIAALLAIATSVIVPPDKAYLDYPDFRTLSCLFGTLAVICALKNVRFFTFLARKIVCMTGDLRAASIALVYITFIGSMLIANDMALLTFLPLGFFVLDSTGQRKYMAFSPGKVSITQPILFFKLLPQKFYIHLIKSSIV